MSDDMETKNKKVIINPTVIKPKYISILSPRVPDSSSLSKQTNSSMSVTLEKIPPKKTQFTMIRKITKTDHGVPNSHNVGYDLTVSY